MIGMSIHNRLPYWLEKGRCSICGHVTKVELYYNYKYKKWRYICRECGKIMEEEWIKAYLWDMPSGMDEEDWEW